MEGKLAVPTFFQFDATNSEDENSENHDKDQEKVKYLPCEDGTPKKCFVCNEEFEKFWHEEEEEWMLKNAIEKEGKFFHPSCYSDYITHKNLQTKLKQQESQAKEENLKQKSEKSTTSLTRVKRKLEEEEEEEEEEESENGENLEHELNKKIKLE